MPPSTTTVSTDLIFQVRQLYDAALESIAHDVVRREGINGLADNALPAYIISVAAVEAFINEFFLSPMAMDFLKNRWPTDIQTKRFEKMELAQKLMVIPRRLFGQTFRSKEDPYRDMHTLITLRNELTHYKMGFNPPEAMKHLEDRRIAFSGNDPWSDRLKTSEGIRWANNTACKTVHRLASFSQENPHHELMDPMARSFLLIDESMARDFLSARGIDPDTDN